MKLLRMESNKKDLLVELVRTNFKLRYNNSILGIIWVLLKPLLMFLILYLVFSRILARGDGSDNYAIYLLSGIIIYTFFSELLIFGMNSLLDKAGIILKVNFPRELAVLSSEMMAVINLAINLVVLAIFMLFSNVSTNFLGLIYFFFVLLVLLIGMLGVSFFTSIWLVKLRDLTHITELITQLLFWATPVVYTLTAMPENIQRLIKLNPLTIILIAARSGLMNGEIQYLEEMMIVFGLSILTLIFGNLYFSKQVKRIAESF